MPAALAVAALVLLTALLVGAGRYRFSQPVPTLPLLAGSWLVFALAVLLLRRVPARAVAALVLAGTLGIGLAALTGPPTTSNDSARYAWDGIVANAGVSPYRYVPADAHLANLRPGWLFPAGVEDGSGATTCPTATPTVIIRTAAVGAVGDICTAINRPHVPTIYPPVAEIVFTAVRALVPPTAEWWPMQVLGLLVVLGTTLLLLTVLRRRGLDPRWAALWGWCPLVASEAVTNAHIDALGAALALAASVLVSGRRPIRGGIVLGLAIAVKFLPVLVAPPLVRRTRFRIAVAALLTVVLLYVPYLATSAGGVLGFLPGYLNEEGYGDGTRSELLSAVLPHALTTPVAVLLIAAVAVVVLVRADPASPWVGQTVVVGSALIIASPRYAWYALLLVPFVAMSGRWEWLAVPLALTLRQLAPNGVTFRTALLVAIVAATAGAALRIRADRRRTAAAAPQPVPVNLGDR